MPVGVGLLVNALTVIVFPPLVSTIEGLSNEIEYVVAASPVTVNLAAETVPAISGRVTPPVLVRVPVLASTTVPATLLTATFPKFMSTDLDIAIGVIMVADDEAVAVTWALTVSEAIDKIAISDKRMDAFFICFKCFRVFISWR